MVTLPKAITFDCYGTLIDWESAIQQFFAQRLAAHNIEGIGTHALQRQWEEIDRVQEQTKVKILKGTESDILADGSLDYPDWILEQFDVIVASIHSRYKMNEDHMTRRIVNATIWPMN